MLFANFFSLKNSQGLFPQDFSQASVIIKKLYFNLLRSKDLSIKGCKYLFNSYINVLKNKPL